MGMLKEFREFAVKGNVVDLAVGVIIGAAFGKIVDSLVNDLIMPVIGTVVGKLDFSNLFVVLGPVPAGTAQTLDALKKAGVPVFAYGNFITVAVNFADPGLHHLPDGQADQPAAARGTRSPRRPRRPRRPRTSCCCARSATACRQPPEPAPGRRSRQLARHADRREQAGGSARPVPAMSKAVPWSGLVRTSGRPSVTFTPCSTPRYFTGIRPWSWYIATTTSNSPGWPWPARRA